MFAVVCRSLFVVCGLLLVVSWFGDWWLGVCCSSCVGCWLLFVVSYVLFVDCGSLCVSGHPLFDEPCSSRVACCILHLGSCLLTVGRFVLFVVCCLLRVVCCLLFGVS